MAVDYLAVLQLLPLAFLSSLLKEVIEYDFKFPAEREAVEKELIERGSPGAARIR